jgi:4-hydroxy-tetrahydrodipicolinate synthase
MRRPVLVLLVTLCYALSGCRLLPRRSCPHAQANCRWAGIYPTVVTPFCESGIDVASLEKQLQRELDGGVHGLLVLGTIGEGQYATPDERAQVIATAVRVANGRVPVVVGIHTSNLDIALAQLQQAKALGADAVLIKYLGNPRASAAEVYAFYAALSDAQILPIFFYHYPADTGLHLTAEDVARILSLPMVVGIKESTLNLRELQAHIRLTRGQGKVYLGCTALNLTQFLDAGGHGLMCPEAVLLPGPTVQAYHAWVQGRHDEARALQSELFALTPILSDRLLPPALARMRVMNAQDHHITLPLRNEHPEARIKLALNFLGVPTPIAVRSAQQELTRLEQKRVERAVEHVKSIDWTLTAARPAPVPHTSQEGDGGLLLYTGAIQLGPDLGHNAWRWLGDHR